MGVLGARAGRPPSSLRSPLCSTMLCSEAQLGTAHSAPAPLILFTFDWRLQRCITVPLQRATAGLGRHLAARFSPLCNTSLSDN